MGSHQLHSPSQVNEHKLFKTFEAESMARDVKHLLRKDEDLSSYPGHLCKSSGTVVHACNHRIGGGGIDRWDPGAPWPDDQVKWVSSRFVRDLVSENKVSSERGAR